MSEKKNEIAKQNAELIVNNAFIDSLANQLNEKCKQSYWSISDYERDNR